MKITQANPESFQSKDVPVCSTLKQFNTVFRSNVVIVLRFSPYPVILNARVEERITLENVCVSLCLCGHTVYACSNVQFASVPVHVCVQAHHSILHTNMQFIDITYLENRDKHR